MLTIRLEEGTEEAVLLPPTSQARLKGCFLCVGPDDQPLVRHEQHLWTYGAVSFSEVAIDQPLRLRVQTDAGDVSDVGAYPGLRIAAGLLIAGGKSGKVLAWYDEVRQVWKHAESLSLMSDVLILPALPAS